MSKEVTTSHGIRKELGVIWKFFYNNVAAYLLLYVQNYLLNKYMPQDALGQFSYLQSMFLLLTSIYSMEVYSAYLRFLGVRDEQGLRKRIAMILMMASVLFSISVLVFFHEPLYVLFAGSMWMRERMYFFRSRLDINTYGMIKISQYLLSTAMLGVLIYSDRLTEGSFLTCLGISYIIVSFVYVHRRGANVNSKKANNLPDISNRELLQYAWPLSFNAIVVWMLGAADQWLINKYLDAATLTCYSVSFRMINILRLGSSVIMEYWPRFYFENMSRNNFIIVKKMQLGFLVFITVICVGAAIFADYIYIFMGASQYVGYSWYFSWLSVAECFRMWGSVYMTFQSFLNRNLINVICLASLGSSKLLTNWYMIEDLGVKVLLETTLMCYILYFLCSIYFGLWQERRYFKYREGR